MHGVDNPLRQKIEELSEREKELKCLYTIEEVISTKPDTGEFLFKLLEIIPSGWQYPGLCRVKILFEGIEYKLPAWNESEKYQKADLVIDNKVSGSIKIYYLIKKEMAGDFHFLPQEQKLLNTIASRISSYIYNYRLANSIDAVQKTVKWHKKKRSGILSGHADDHWLWRKQIVELMAERLDFERFGIKGIYLIGSTKNAKAGPASDIDIIVHVADDRNNHNGLKAWIEGWSLCLSEINFNRTGYKTDGLIDLHLITDDDILKKTSYGVMIGNHTDGASPVKIKGQ